MLYLGFGQINVLIVPVYLIQKALVLQFKSVKQLVDRLIYFKPLPPLLAVCKFQNVLRMAGIGAGRLNRVGIVLCLCTAWMRAFVFRMVSIHRLFLRFNMNFGLHIEGGGPRHLFAAYFLLAMGRNTAEMGDFLSLLHAAWSDACSRASFGRKVRVRTPVLNRVGNHLGVPAAKTKTGSAMPKA